MKLSKILITAVLLIVSFSCKKDNPEPTPEELENYANVNAANSLLTVETFLNEMEYIVRNAPSNQPSISFMNCASVTKQDVTGGQEVTVTFNAGSQCIDNQIRSGKLIITYQTGTGNATVTTNEYKIGNLTVKGTYNFQPVTENQQTLFSLVVQDGEFSVSENNYIRFSVERKSNFMAGQTTGSTDDDVFEITDSFYNLELKDASATVLIDGESIEAYTVKYSCSQMFRPRSGKLSFSRSTGTEKVLLFGNGSCNSQPSLQ